jgi:hypothetical protein
MLSKSRIKVLVSGTSDNKWIILVRLIVGLIFLSEGIQKYLFPAGRWSVDFNFFH